MSVMKRKLSETLLESLKMFAVFFKIGLFSFGGGYAMLTMIEHEVVEKRNWLTHGELMDIFAIAESTPGAISINIATFIGTKRAGVLGGIITTLGVVLPSFLVILALSYIIDLVRDNKWINYLFRGVRVGVVVLIVQAALKFVKNMKRTVVAFALMAAMFLLATFTEVSVIYLMLGAIGLSVIAVVVTHFAKNRKMFALLTSGTPEYSRNAEHFAETPCPENLLICNLTDDSESANEEKSEAESDDEAERDSAPADGNGENFSAETDGADSNGDVGIPDGNHDAADGSNGEESRK